MEPRCRTFEAPRRGQSDSNDLNSMQDLLVTDVHKLATELNATDSSLAKALQILVSETRAAREEIERLKQVHVQEAKLLAALNQDILYVNAWRRTKDLVWSSGGTTIPVTRRMRVDTSYGQATIPFNNTADRLVYRSFDTDKLLMNPDVAVEVSAVSETGALKTVAGIPASAFNGINESYWVREVLYDPKEDVAAVECQLDVVAPSAQISNANMLVLHPYPVGIADIVEILYSTDGSTPTLVLGADNSIYPDSLSFPINNAPFLRMVFPPLAITNLRVKLRQRNFANRDGYKSFQYGLQELALRLIDYDTLGVGVDDPNPAVGHSIITEVQCPDSYRFKFITGFWSTPQYKTGAGGWPVYYRIYTDAALSNLVWQSFVDATPQDVYVDVSASATGTLYVVASAAYNNVLSVPPILEDFALRYTTRPGV